MPENDESAALTDFGVTVGNYPRVEKRAYVDLDGRQVGLLGYDRANETRVYVTERNTDEHRYHGQDPWYDLPFDGDGYGLSLDVFERIDGWGATRVYVAETDTGDVHYYSFRQFVDGTTINNQPESEGRGREKDLQNIVAIDNAVRTWEGVFGDLYVKTL